MAADIQSTILEVSKRLKDLIDERTQVLLAEAAENAKSTAGEIRFSYDEELTEHCRKFGRINRVDGSPVSPSKTHVTGSQIHKSTVDQVSYIYLHLRREDGKECFSIDRKSVKVKLTNINDEVECTAELVKMEGCVMTYKYTPIEPGEHQLHVTIDGSHVNGSPIRVDVAMPLHLKCITTHTLTGYYKPGGVAVGMAGEVAIVDGSGYNTVHVYNRQLELMMSFGKWGGGKGECYGAVGVAFDLKGNFLIVDGDNHRVHKFDRQGKFLQTVGEKGKGQLQFLRPTGIGVNKAGLVYVCDRGNDRVQILKPDLTFDKFFGMSGQMPGNLHYPWDVAFDSEGLVYITDPGNRCIKKFTSNGEFRMKIGPNTTGEAKDELQCVEMLCIDEYDYIYVTDRDANKVVVFDTNGEYHLSIGNYGYSEGQFYQPRGIAKDSTTGALYVSEVGNKRVQKLG